MAKADPTKAIHDAIADLKAGIQPVEDQISEIRKKAESDVRALESEIQGTKNEIQRWEDALAIAEGKVNVRRPATRSTRTRARRGSTPDVTATQAQLVAALKKADAPMAASEVRQALGVPEDVPANKISAFLNEALESGKIVKQGERRGTKYSLA